mgnify:CR=1 FL=1
MKKILLTLGVGLVLTGCSSGISQSQYECVVAERDSYKQQLNEFIKETEDTSPIENQQDEKTSAANTDKADLASKMEIAEYSYENSIGDTFIFTLLKTILIRL